MPRGKPIVGWRIVGMRWATLVAAPLVMISLASDLARAYETPSAPPPTSLRLDEGLPLLSAFRHGAGQTEAAAYGTSAYGTWTTESWFVLDWAAALEDAAPFAPPAEAPVWSPPPVGGTRAFAPGGRRGGGQPGFPFAFGEAPWLSRPVTPGLTLSSRYWPAGLTGVSPEYLQVLWLLGACGRGGDCSYGTAFPAPLYAALATALRPPPPETPPWPCRERPVRVMSHGGEREVFIPQRCDGSIPPRALERLSRLARPTGVPRPEAWPDEPLPEAGRGEWLPGVRLLHPRLLWVLARIAAAYPWREIYIYSGYRKPTANASFGPGSHRSQHHEGRALDLSVRGVSNEALLALCWDLGGLACGYYPNNRFVHIDVRHAVALRRGARTVWVDTSAPGQPSQYVASWPGVVEDGVVVYAPTTP